jgi:hypothetical protein
MPQHFPKTISLRHYCSEGQRASSFQKSLTSFARALTFAWDYGSSFQDFQLFRPLK